MENIVLIDYIGKFVFLLVLIFIASRINKALSFYSDKMADEAKKFNTTLKNSSFINNCTYPSIIIDNNGFILVWSNQAQIFFNILQGNAIGKKISEILGSNEIDALLSKYRETADYNLLKKLIQLKLNISNSEKYVELTLFPLEKNARGYFDIGLIIVDLTQEHIKQEKLLKEVEFMHQGEIDGNQGAWYWDTISKDVKVSKNYCKIYGIEPTDFITTDRITELIFHEDREKILKESEDAIKEKRSYFYIYHRLLEDGTLRRIANNAKVVLDDDGEVIGLHGVILNIDERIKEAPWPMLIAEFKKTG